MSVGYRGGSIDELGSIRVHAIVDGLAAAAFVVTKMRPPLVAAQTTFWSEGAGSFAEMWPPERSVPHGYGPGREPSRPGSGSGWPGSGTALSGRR